MRHLWFKGEFVAAILSGEKCDTIRVLSKRLPAVGETVNFSVGPRRPFAQALIERREPIAADQLSSARQADVKRCIGKIDDQLVRLTFLLLPPEV